MTSPEAENELADTTRIGRRKAQLRMFGLRESRFRNPTPILDDRMAIQISKLSFDLSDDTRVGDLRIPPRSINLRDYKYYNFLYDCNPPKAWEEYYESLDRPGRRVLSEVLERASRAGFKTVGSIRIASMEELQEPKRKSSNRSIITARKARFLKLAFPPPGYEGPVRKVGEWTVFQ